MTEVSPSPQSNFPTWLAGLFLVAVVAMNLPGVLCMSLDIDTSTFDLYLRGMHEGKVLYRDMIENNLPGVMWVHGITRSLFGWSSVALQAVDLAIIGGAVLLLGLWQRGLSVAGRLWLTSFLLCFYFSTSEWVHCQRDPWTLLPLMGALFLRRSQLEGIASGSRSAPVILSSGLFEGLLWGLAVWIKPHVAVAAVPTWLVGLHWSWRRGSRLSLLVLDLISVIGGGLLCGGLGVLWMKANACWEPYLEHMRNLRNFYFAADMYSPLTVLDWRYFQLFSFYPWSLVGVGSLAFAAVFLIRGVFSRNDGLKLVGSDPSTLLFGALFLGFTFQSLFLQHVFDYAIAPVVMLGLAWAGMALGRSTNPREQLLLGFFLGITAFMGHGKILKQRLPIWERCIKEGPTWEIKDKLLILRRTEWNSLKKVKEFLETQNVQNGELTVFVEGGIPLYEELGLRPTTRSYMMTNQIMSLPYRREQIGEELKASKQRFVFTSTLFMNRKRANLTDEPALENDPLPEYWYSSRDWTKYIVFRSGMYMILEMPPELTMDWARDVLGL